MNISRFIIVDDDDLNNMVCRITIKSIRQDIDVVEIKTASDALAFIQLHYVAGKYIPTILLLDINMPVMTGWDFLDRFRTLEDNIRNQIRIFMITSSIDQRDKERSETHHCVSDFISKPLLPSLVRQLITTAGFDVREVN